MTRTVYYYYYKGEKNWDQSFNLPQMYYVRVPKAVEGKIQIKLVGLLPNRNIQS